MFESSTDNTAFTIIEEMTKLRVIFQMPVIYMKDGKCVEVKYRWNNKKAEELYLKLEQLLKAVSQYRAKHNLGHAPWSASGH